MMCSIASRRSAPLAYACALILRVHTSAASFIIPLHVFACRVAFRCRTRVRASRHARAARGAET